MKFSCETSLIKNGVNVVKKAISSSNNAPIFSGVHLILKENNLEIIAMDLNFYMSNTIEVKGEEDGDVVVPAKYFSELLSNLDNEEIKIEKEDKGANLTITTQNGSFDIPIMAADEYPEFPNFEGEKKIVFPEEKIRDLINKTSYACSTDDTRPLFTGVLLEKKGNSVTCVGTNTHRLAIKTVELEEEDNSELSIIIPSRMLKEIVANTGKEIPETVEISLLNKQIQAKISNVKIISSLIDGTFPDYKRVIPPQFTCHTTFKTNDMEKAVKRVSLFSKEDYSIVRINVKETAMILNSGISDIGKAEEAVNCVTKGETLNIAFNSKYIIDILKYADADEVCMEMNNSLSPVCIRPLSEENYIYIVTPVRVIF